MKNDLEQLTWTFLAARGQLIAQKRAEGYWQGDLSSSALSTAVAVCALALVDSRLYGEEIVRGCEWLLRSANPDGGWGDTVASGSNIAATLLAWSALAAAGEKGQSAQTRRNAEAWIARAAGGLDAGHIAAAVDRRYGDDRTFSVPILATCAIEGRLGSAPQAWEHVAQLPFELAAVPHGLLKWLRLPVVSYALPALIALGQVRHYHLPARNALACLLRRACRRKTLKVLQRIQPASGGFLEAAPLTGFVAIALAGMGMADHPVARKCAGFLASTVRPDGSWPIDVNLAIWVTTLSLNALAGGGDLGESLSPEQRAGLARWLLDRQQRREHPCINNVHTPLGGWGWTDLPGAVPDADDTAGALLALHNISAAGGGSDCQAIEAGVSWLLELQNADGGVPTFCRGRSQLPFDRSSPDLTAHCLLAWKAHLPSLSRGLAARTRRAIAWAGRYLTDAQQGDGAWSALWFGNEAAVGQRNLTYGTARVLLALAEFTDAELDGTQELAGRGLNWLLSAQRRDGGWGGDAFSPPSIEETALAVDALAKWAARPPGGQSAPDRLPSALAGGAAWLVRRTQAGRRFDPSPIGLYFAKLWYYERLYPLIFTVSALGRLRRTNLWPSPHTANMTARDRP